MERIARIHCVHGHLWIAENLTPFKQRGKTYYACRLCNNARSRGKRVRDPKRAPSPLKTECRIGHPFVEENIIRVGSRRECRTCRIVRQIQKQAARRLKELRWLNGPCVVVPSDAPAYGSGSRPTPWKSLERIEHGPRRRRFNPWTRSFESKWIEPPIWQEILRQSRPTPAELRYTTRCAKSRQRTRRWRARNASTTNAAGLRNRPLDCRGAS